MKIKVGKKANEKMNFTIEGIDPPFANALRRAMMGEVSTLAIDETDVRENSSAIYNEVLAHRLALVPLQFDPKKMNLREECVCEGKGCVQCEVVFVLKKEGPGTVYAKDLKSNNDDVRVMYDKMPLVLLMEGQKVELEAVARLGRGVDHAKWQAAIASYEYDPKTAGSSMTFEFRVESVCGLTPEQIVTLALDVLESKAKTFEEKVSEYA
ncbi:MAG: DNA-directed RNA polymerase subunit D [Candidatus Aenigmarchaeota archaeon]|nr:DNA-directed RNA polymerase subunit D [Candidatus Aenigmarchaeota archaeon]